MNTATTHNLIRGILLLIVAVAPRGGASAADPSAAEESSRIRYARTYVELARLNLQVAVDRNQLAPDTLPRGQMEVLEVQLAMAQQWLRQAEDEQAGKPSDVAIKVAEILAKAAEMDYASALEVNRRSPIAPQKLEQLRLKVELAKQRIAVAKDLDPKSPTALLQFQLERLRENVAELTQQQIKFLDRN